MQLRYACEEASETTQLQAPDSLSCNGSFGAKRSSKKKKNEAQIKIYCRPRNVQNRSGLIHQDHFTSDKCLFNLDELPSREVLLSTVCSSVICSRSVSVTDRGTCCNTCRSAAQTCGRTSPADCGGRAPDLGFPSFLANVGFFTYSNLFLKLPPNLNSNLTLIGGLELSPGFK